MDDGLIDLDWDPVGRVHTLPLSYILFNFIPETVLIYNSKKSKHISSFVSDIKDMLDTKWPLCDLFASGSMIEGLGLSISLFKEGYSDLDIMISHKQYDFVIDDCSQDLHPGYVRIIVNDSAKYGEFAENGLKYMPITLSEEIRGPWNVQGPALSGALWGPDFIDTDFVTCLPCPEWPTQAEEWITRRKPSGWPSEQLIHQIVSGGCYVVPVAHAHSSFPQFDWRYSFSKAEVLLANSLSFHQKNIYILFKLLAKQATKTSKLLKTYYLKNVMFHCCEKIPTEYWKPKHFAPCLFELIDFLLGSLEKGEILQYFVNRNNIISHLPRESVEIMKREISCLRYTIVDHLIILDDLNIIRFDIRKSGEFKNAFKEVIQCLPQITTSGMFIKHINQTEEKLALPYLKKCRVLLAADCFKNRIVFFDDKHKFPHGESWQLRFMSFVEKYLEQLSPVPMITSLVMLSHNDFVTVDTLPLKNIIKTTVKQRFDYQGILRTFPNDQASRACYLLHYSVYYLVTGQYDEAYIHAKSVLDDSVIDHSEELRMDIAFSFEPVILEKILSVSGITKPSIHLNALYLAAKSIKRTVYKNKKGHLLNTQEHTFRKDDGTFKGVDVLLVALIYMETNQFIAAAKFYCMEFFDTNHEPRKVWQLRQDILTSLVLELLQISTIDEFLASPKLTSIAERTLDLISYNLLHDVESIDEIGDVFLDLTNMYFNSKTNEFNEIRMKFAYNAAMNCKEYFKKLTNKAVHMSQNWV